MGNPRPRHGPCHSLWTQPPSKTHLRQAFVQHKRSQRTLMACTQHFPVQGPGQFYARHRTKLALNQRNKSQTIMDVHHNPYQRITPNITCSIINWTTKSSKTARDVSVLLCNQKHRKTAILRERYPSGGDRVLTCFRDARARTLQSQGAFHPSLALLHNTCLLKKSRSRLAASLGQGTRVAVAS